MQPDYRIILICAVAALTAACTTISPQPEPPATVVVVPIAAPPPPVEPDKKDAPNNAALSWWFDYYRKIGEQPQAVVTKEYQNTEAAYASDKSLHVSLRLITLLSLREVPFHNSERAIKLLDELIADTRSQPQSLRDAAAVMRSKLIAEQEDSKKIQSLLGQVKDIQNTNKEIQNQLNALKEIERSLHQRDKTEVNNKR